MRCSKQRSGRLGVGLIQNASMAHREPKTERGDNIMRTRKFLRFLKKFPACGFIFATVATLLVISPGLAQAQQNTNFGNGVTNVVSTDLFGELPQLDITRTVSFFDDFTIPSATAWTNSDGGVNTYEKVFLPNYSNRFLRTTIVSATDPYASLDGTFRCEADNHNNDHEGWNTTQSLFTLESGKKAWFAARIVSTTVECDIFVGLASFVLDASTYELTNDGVYFRKDDGDWNIDFVVKGSGASTATTAVSTMVTDTYAEVGFYYNGDDKIKIFVDNVHVGTSATTYLPAVALSPSWCVINGDSGAIDDGATLTLDYFYAVKER